MIRSKRNTVVVALAVVLGSTAYGSGREPIQKPTGRENPAPQRKAPTPDDIVLAAWEKAAKLPPAVAAARERDIRDFALRLERLARTVREQQDLGNTRLALDCLREIEFVTEGLGGKLTMGKWDEYTGMKHNPGNQPPPPPAFIPPPPPR